MPEHATILAAGADKGDGQASWTLFNYYSFHHDERMFRYLRLAAEQGVPEAQCTLYAQQIQSRDPREREQAVEWLRKAVKQGYPFAIEQWKHHQRRSERSH